MIVHRFGSLDTKQEQRYNIGIGPRKFQFKRPNLGWTEANRIRAFWESMRGRGRTSPSQDRKARPHPGPTSFGAGEQPIGGLGDL